MILVDTSVLIRFFKGSDNGASRTFRSILEQNIPFGITSFIFQEVLQGAKNKREYDHLGKYLRSQKFFHPKHPVDTFEAAARIYFNVAERGLP